MAFVPQEAWVQNASVLDNVRFCRELDPPWLERVLDACALWPDVHSFPDGVHTQLGEQVKKGVWVQGTKRRRGRGTGRRRACRVKPGLRAGHPVSSATLSPTPPHQGGLRSFFCRVRRA